MYLIVCIEYKRAVQKCVLFYRGQPWPNGKSVGLVTRGCGFWISAPVGIVHDWGETLEQGTEPSTAPRTTQCRLPTAPGVCALEWVKCREHISLLVILCIIVYVTNKKLFFFNGEKSCIPEDWSQKGPFALLGIMYNTRQSKWSVNLCTAWNSIGLWVLDGVTWEIAATTTSLYIHMTVKHYQAHSAENRCVCVREKRKKERKRKRKRKRKKERKVSHMHV